LPTTPHWWSGCSLDDKNGTGKSNMQTNTLRAKILPDERRAKTS
jgi:hypothetical protein